MHCKRPFRTVCILLKFKFRCVGESVGKRIRRGGACIMWARTVLLTRLLLQRTLLPTGCSLGQSARVGRYRGKTAVRLASFSKAMATSYLDQESALKLDVALFNDYMFSVDQLMEIAGLCVAQVQRAARGNSFPFFFFFFLFFFSLITKHTHIRRVHAHGNTQILYTRQWPGATLPTPTAWVSHVY